MKLYTVGFIVSYTSTHQHESHTFSLTKNMCFGIKSQDCHFLYSAINLKGREGDWFLCIHNHTCNFMCNLM